MPNYLLQKAEETSKNRQTQTKVGSPPKILTYRPNSTKNDTNRHVSTNIDKVPEIFRQKHAEYSDFFGYGPSVNQPEYFLGKTSGWFLDTNTFERITQTYLDNADQYSHFNYWRYENIKCWCPATVGIEIVDGSVVVDENGKEYDISCKPTGDTLMEIARIRKECTSVDEQYSVSQRYSWGQYMTDEFSPTVCYFDEETTLRIDELKALITEHASHEIAKFVTGERDLSELDAYFDELQMLGVDEYVKYYADYYEALNS